jgi:hypothetical protein
VTESERTIGFVAGASCLGYLIAALFFLKFWRRTGDGLFAAFAAAFVLMATNQFVQVLFGVPDEALGWVYLLRVAAFLLIIAAVVRKNLTRK